jgi:hypothetical protein
MSLSSSPPLRKKRTPYGAAALPQPPPVPEHVDVTAGENAPDPDCTGTYLYFQDHDEAHAYRRTSPTTFYLWSYNSSYCWFISADPPGEPPENNWQSYIGPGSEFMPNGEYTGTALASEVIPATP